MRLPRLTGFALLVVATATIGCGDPTSPLPGVFVLRSVNSDPLPAELGPGPGGSTIVLSGFVTLQADGTAVLVTVTRGGILGEQTSTRVLRYRLDKHRIVIEPTDCPPNALCALITGVLINSDLSLDFGFSPDGPIYLYHRADTNVDTPD
jgi:hypothetical protein